MKSKFLKRILTGIIAVVFSTTFILAPSTSAKGIKDSIIDLLDKINAYYYNPEGDISCVGAYQGDITVYGGAIEEKIWTGLTSFMSEEQAAGVMGNMVHESGYNPARHEGSMMNSKQPGFDISKNADVSYGLGLIQWSFGRRTRLYSYIENKDSELTDYLKDYKSYGALSGDAFLSKAGDSVADSLIAIELEFLKDELKASYSGLFSTNSVYDAAKYFLEKVERPKNPTISAHPERATTAESIYKKFTGTSITPSINSDDDDCATSSGDAGALQALVLQYAWPESHPAPFTNRKAAYAEAVERRQSAGKYVGGSVNGVAGIDCGGFITTLMQESGFAPDYNSGGGNTSAQESWVKSHGWKLLNDSENTPVDTSTLQPGDVAFSKNHTFVYVGNIPGFGSKIASASYGSSSARAPMAGLESLTKGHGVAVRWYRKP